MKKKAVTLVTAFFVSKEMINGDEPSIWQKRHKLVNFRSKCHKAVIMKYHLISMPSQTLYRYNEEFSCIILKMCYNATKEYVNAIIYCECE